MHDLHTVSLDMGQEPSLHVKRLSDYEPIVGEDALREISDLASGLSGTSCKHINSTREGGGVAEILQNLVPLFRDAGIHAEWDVITGNDAFFKVTKNFHNALQGGDIDLTDEVKRTHISVNEENAKRMSTEGFDFVVNHDPQPLPLVNFLKQGGQPWFWRCHIDASKPNPILWKYLSENFVKKHDAMIVSMESYKQKNVEIPQYVIQPSIDPLSEKNRELSERDIERKLAEYEIDPGVPIITQVSRFDKWKDPKGVLDAFRIAKRHHPDCQLILVGNMASDDPEGQMIYDSIVNECGPDVKLITKTDNVLVNALQRKSRVILQKSLREGFGLTVSEALWKGTPVIGGNVGGIPLQIIDGVNGYLVNNVEEAADRMKRLLDDPALASKMGNAGREHVRRNFLITRNLRDYLHMFTRHAPHSG